ncbi:MAG TPA: site-2 protease family protein [Chlorobaculum parvum]|uniref:Site-2 protease family protein n=1 Tax=Chlorobaculum parvum TaxID=274539 RepID=A0A7C5HE91_9CHLB|nr:site-2 protease family protein [Chlorobaculum parvum]
MKNPVFPPSDNPWPKLRSYPLHLLLLLVTLFTATWAGAEWAGKSPAITNADDFTLFMKAGLPYSLSMLGFLTVHEFGHFFAAMHHRLRATLPYYIPIPPFPDFLNLGTMGAVIRIKEPISSTRILFDTGSAGPLAGFAVALGLLVYGFLILPPASYAAASATLSPQPGTLIFGKNLLFILLESVFSAKAVPPMTELYRHPMLFTGWLACFVTALNLLPVGQLDGGHVIYAMFGDAGHRKIANAFLGAIIILGLPAFTVELASIFVPSVTLPIPEIVLRHSWPGWIVWAFILKQFIGTRHPAVSVRQRLSPGRTIAGWLCIALFILTFTPMPFDIF